MRKPEMVDCIPLRLRLLLPAVLSLAALAAQSKATRRYLGDIHGAKANAVVTYEKVYDYVVAAGRIDSNGYRYSFTADLYGDSGYGSMLSHADNERFHIKIQLTRKGFTLTSNPHGPGTPTTYYFTAI